MNNDDMIFSSLKKPAFHVRFWEKVDRSGDCWLWTGCRQGFGYGIVSVGKRETGGPTRFSGAHRVALAIGGMPLANNLCVLHRCDNPRCVRPSHLFQGTLSENNADMRAKKRHAKGRMVKTAILTDSQVVQCRRLHKSGMRQTEIAKMFGVSASSVWSIVHGRAWKHTISLASSEDAD